MAGEHLEMRARRVVTGVNEGGKSIIVSDDLAETRVATDAFTINQIWQVDQLPPSVMEEDTTTAEVSIAPPQGGFNYFITTFPPDSDWDMAAGYADALSASGDAGSHVGDSEIAGLHETDTLDIITVLSGEMYAVLEDAEVLLKPGDSFVQRGTKHAWSNRSDTPCTIVAVMMGAVR